MTEPASSPSKASCSNSVRRSRPKPRLARTLRRGGVGFHVARDDDARWLWAAYRRGAFPDAAEGMDRERFLDWLAERAAAFHEVWILTAPNEDEKRPVGVVAGRFDEYGLRPHVIWFPWSTPRNRMECALKFLHDIGREHFTWFIARREDVPFFDHLIRYGMIRAVGKVKRVFDGGDGIMYHTTERRE